MKRAAPETLRFDEHGSDHGLACGSPWADPCHPNGRRPAGKPVPQPQGLPRFAGKWYALVLLPVIALLVPGCSKGAPAANGNDNGAEPVQPIVKTAEVGPVKMTVTADKNRVTIAERLKLTIDVFAATGVDVEMEEPGEKLNEFQIRDYANQPAQAAEGGRRWTRTYDLDIFLSGEYSIPELTAHFTDRREGAAGRASPATSQPVEGTIRTEPFTITVTSLLEGTFDPTKFRDVKGPVELPVVRRWAWLRWAAVGGAAVVAAVLLVAWWRRRRRRDERTIRVPPHEWAFDQLRLLIDEHLVEQGRVHEFYYRLSQIVRIYIELRFGLMAPERTTEEFLVEVHRSDALRTDHQRRLGEFLTACDLVKFAKYEPTTPEIEGAFDSARGFVEQTIPQREPAVTEAAA